MYSENFVSKKLKAFAEKNDWLISGEYIYGEEQGYLFSGLDGKNQKTFITPVPGITEEQQTELFEALEKNRNTMKLTDFKVADDFLCIRIKDSMQLKSDDIEFIIALLVGILQELNITAVERCQGCLEMGVAEKNFLFELQCYMHEDCAKAVDDDMEDTESEGFVSEGIAGESILSPLPVENEDQDDVKLSRKILFTISGAILGSIPWLLLPFILDMVFDLISKLSTNTVFYNFSQSLLTCVCAYLVSYFAIIGYRISNAKMNTKGRWIVGITSIAIIILVQFAYLAILVVKEPNVALNFKNYILNLAKFTFYINMILGAVIGIVFTLIAVHPFFDSRISSAGARRTLMSKKNPDKSNETVESGNTVISGDTAAPDDAGDTIESDDAGEMIATDETEKKIDEDEKDEPKKT